jgi:hypothetical protein
MTKRHNFFYLLTKTPTFATQKSFFMFLMNSVIIVSHREGDRYLVYSNIKPNAIKWKCSVSNFADTCTVTLPLAPYMRNNKANHTIFAPDTGAGDTVFAEGDYITIDAGYNYDYKEIFKGYIRRVNYAQPLVLECEGFPYQLKDLMFNKSYKKTTLKQILNDVIKGTTIKLSPYIPDVNLSSLTFKNVPGLKMLEWFQKELLCAVWFDFDTLYVGASRYAVPKPTVKLRIGWNTAEDKELKRSQSDTKVIINLVEKSSAGKVKRTKSEASRYDNIKEVKVRAGLPDSFLRAVAAELQKKEDYRGYQGNVTAFLQPYFGKGYVCQIIDEKFPDRQGKYFVEAVEGDFSEKGGRQKLTLIYYGK